jgi:hypothetical protein
MPYVTALELLALIFFGWQISRALGRIARALEPKVDKVDAEGPPDQVPLD